MPANHIVPATEHPVVIVTKSNGEQQQAHILQTGDNQVYVHYLNSDKRLDEWVPQSATKPFEQRRGRGRPRKRKRTTSPHPGNSNATGQNGSKNIVMTEEDFDIEHHKKITAQRNFDKVYFGDWEIKTWYFSPYPLTENEDPGDSNARAASTSSTLKLPGVSFRSASHKRTSDVFATGLGRTHGQGDTTLWVCEFCLKYMTDGTSWELHGKTCLMTCPPGRKVYQRGAHTIFEVDGAQQKLYCQNLSLFGKLFIDVKTIFFDCDNFMFYILTDATSSTDHILGFFSKEKVSYDGYNLACIITLPPYQRKGYGILMIEFSYELSRQAGKVGTPERPLTDLGLRSYLAYWVSTLIRFFRRILSVLPPGARITTEGELPDLRSPPEMSEDSASPPPRRKKRAKGWDGEVQDDVQPTSPSDYDPLASRRTYVTTAMPDGSAVTHVIVKCTLEEIARATNLRIDDAAFALNEVGLLAKRLAKDSDHSESQDTIVLTREMVEKVAVERNVKIPCISLSHVVL